MVVRWCLILFLLHLPLLQCLSSYSFSWRLSSPPACIVYVIIFIFKASCCRRRLPAEILWWLIYYIYWAFSSGNILLVICWLLANIYFIYHRSCRHCLLVIYIYYAFADTLYFHFQSTHEYCLTPSQPYFLYYYHDVFSRLRKEQLSFFSSIFFFSLSLFSELHSSRKNQLNCKTAMYFHE